MTPTDSTSQRVRRAIEGARTRRYPAILVLVAPDGEEPDLSGPRVSEELACLDCLAAAESDPAFRRASHVWRSFLDYLRAKAREEGPLLVRDVDAVVARWSETQRRQFFTALLRWECRAPTGSASIPVVVPSRLAGALGLATNPHGQAVVIDLAEEG